MSRSSSLPYRKVRQARSLLWAAEGVANEEIGRRCETTAYTLRRWRTRFAAEGLSGVGEIAAGRGRKSWLAEGTVAEVVRITREEVPEDGSTHWTTRSLAARLGIDKDTVARIWRDHGLKPWQTKTFKISSDPTSRTSSSTWSVCTWTRRRRWWCSVSTGLSDPLCKGLA